ncbi:protein D2-like [Planococcus citri]|uniref:protein D2-like n=1 Tax=Planococcus citri TaxID=170843 RepID=UPI0031F95518
MTSVKIAFYSICMICAAYVCVAPLCPEIGKLLKDSKVIPDLINEVPEDIVTVVWMDNQTEMVPGTLYHEHQVAFEPGLFYEPINGTYYTSILTTPDGVKYTPPYIWLNVNIPGLMLHEGDNLTNFTPPPAIFKDQRYVFLIYEQPSRMKFERSEVFPNYPNFNLAEFLSKFTFKRLIGANYFRLRH